MDGDKKVMDHFMTISKTAVIMQDKKRVSKPHASGLNMITYRSQEEFVPQNIVFHLQCPKVCYSLLTRTATNEILPPLKSRGFLSLI